MKMKNLKVVFMGTPEFSVKILKELIDNCDVIGVVSQPDKIVGRKKVLEKTPVKLVALENNIKVIQPVNIKKDYQEIIDLNPDIIVTCAYGQIIPKELLDFPKYGCINVHASLLPKLRGGAPIHRSIIDDYGKTGITIMYMDEKMDEGDIISQEETLITSQDNLVTLSNRLSDIGAELLIKTIKDIISGKSKRIKQDSSLANYAPNIKREEEHIDFNKTSREIRNLIRGLYDTPGANLILDGKEMKIYDAEISDRVFMNKENGEITAIYKNGFGISTRDGEIIITKLKPFGKKKMTAKDYLNGINKNELIGKVVE